MTNAIIERTEDDLEIEVLDDAEDALEAAEHLDWKKVSVHGGEPCFAIEHELLGNDEIHVFCLKSKQWHSNSPDYHQFVSIVDMVRSIMPEPEPPEIPEEEEATVESLPAVEEESRFDRL